MKKQITNNQYLQLVGLLTLAKRHDKALKQIEQAVAEILGAPDEGGYYGWASDAVYSDHSADELLKNADILVRQVRK